MSRKLFIATTVVALSGTLAVFAIQKDDPAAPGDAKKPSAKQPADRPQTVEAGQYPQWKNADHALASCVAAANQVEVALGELGTSRSQNEDVKKFAGMLVMDHHEFLKKLHQFAPESTQEGYLIRTDAKEARTKDKSPNKVGGKKDIQPVAGEEDANKTSRVETAAGTTPTDAAGRAFPHSQIEKELAQQCLNSATEKLGEKSGAEFDQCYLGLQIAMHMHMKDKLIVFQRHATGELAQILAEGQKKTEQHLAKAEELMKDLDKKGDGPRGRKNRDGEKNTKE